MKKRLSIILLLLTISLCSIVSIDRVLGVEDGIYKVEDDYEPGTSSSVSKCENSYCYSGATGFRVTLVNATTGKRCNYSYNEKTKELDICSDDASSTPTISKDYWFQKSDIEYFINSGINYYCVAYGTKSTKVEHIINNDYSNNIVSCSEYSYGELKDIFKNYDQFNKWDYRIDSTGGGTIEASRVPQNMKYVREWLIDNLKNQDFTEINAIAKAVTGKNQAVTIVGKEKVSIQFEQLLMVANYYGNSSGFVAVGTVAETTYLYLNNYSSSAGSGTPAHRWCTIYKSNSSKFTPAVISSTLYKDGKLQTASSGKFRYNYIITDNNNRNKDIVNLIDCKSSMFSGGYWTGWSGGQSFGQEEYELKNNLPSNSVVSNISTYLNGKFTKDNLPIESFYNEKSTANVYNIKISDYLNCSDSARDILKNYGINSGFNEEVKNINNYNDIKNALKTAPATKNCFDQNGNLKDSCFQLSEEYLENVGVAPNVDLCKKDCGSLVENSINKDGISDDYKDKNSTYSRIISYLFFGSIVNQKNPNGIFSDQDGLNPVLWQDIFGEKAKCDAEILSCQPNKSSAHCNGSTSIVLSDYISTTDEDKYKCIKNGWAYNDKNSQSDTFFSVAQSSVDYDFGLNQSPGHCYEKVEFTFPKGGQTAVAGTVFSWGIDNDKNSNKFGTMIVTRKCFVSEHLKSSDAELGNYEIKSEWVSKISPEILVEYVQAVYDENLDIKYKSINEKLDFEFKEVTTTIKNASDGKVSGNFGVQDSTNKTISVRCFNGYDKDNKGSYSNCNKINNIEMTAYFDIIYNDNFKWYADKANNGELNTNDPNVEIESSYIFAGYGLPIPYITADNIYCESSYGVSGAGAEGTANGTGKLNVIVSNVGTKNKDGTYHFDKLIRTDDLFEDDNNSSEKIDYYCDFKVSNPLFDTEYNSSSAAKCDPRIPKGIDVVFRTVDLISDADHVGDAFPGRSGTGRTLGANWAKYDESTIADILSDKVYQEEPMYEITLDSPLIQQIRVWNNEARAAGIDPYTDMSEVDNGEDINAGNTGYFYSNLDKTVRSRFLTKLYDQYNGKGKFKSICIKSGSEEGLYNRVKNCNQSWWKEETDDKNTITINITEKSIEE